MWRYQCVVNEKVHTVLKVTARKLEDGAMLDISSLPLRAESVTKLSSAAEDNVLLRPVAFYY